MNNISCHIFNSLLFSAFSALFLDTILHMLSLFFFTTFVSSYFLPFLSSPSTHLPLVSLSLISLLYLFHLFPSCISSTYFPLVSLSLISLLYLFHLFPSCISSTYFPLVSLPLISLLYLFHLFFSCISYSALGLV